MSQAYYDPKREREPHALPDLEVFYHDAETETLEAEGTDEPLGSGWYYWTCMPGCMPDSDPIGPYDSEAEALQAARESADTDGIPEAMSRIGEEVGAPYYVADSGCLWCEDCAPDDAEEVPSDECDSPPMCDHCGGMLDCTLTTEGEESVRQALKENTGAPEVLKLWRETWPELAPKFQVGDRVMLDIAYDADKRVGLVTHTFYGDVTVQWSDDDSDEWTYDADELKLAPKVEPDPNQTKLFDDNA